MVESFDKIEVAYRPEYRDFLRVTLRWIFRKFWFIYAFMIFIALMMIFYALTIRRIEGLFSLIVPFGMLTLLTSSAFLSARRSIKSLKQGVRYLFSPEAVEVRGPEVEAKFGWSNYHSIKETSDDFILSPTRNALIPFPKRLFRDDTEIRRFRDLVRDAMGDKAQLKR